MLPVKPYKSAPLVAVLTAMVFGATGQIQSVLAQLTATGTAGETAGVTDNEILIGSCCALDGPVKFLGTEQIAGAKAYLDYIKDKGGVNGRKIRLATYNDNYDPDRAIECFNHLLKDDVFAGAFFVGTPTAAKYVPMAEAKKMPLVGLLTGAQLLYEPFKPHVINVRASYYEETKEQIDHLVNDLHVKRIAVLLQSDGFGAAVLAGVKRALDDHHMEPVALGSFSRNSVDADQAIAAVRKANPEAVVMAGGYNTLAAIVKNSHSQGWKPIFTTVSFVGTEAFIKAAGKDADGTVISQVVPSYTRDDLPTVVQYKKLLKKYEPNEKPNFVSFEGFVDAIFLVEGLPRA